ncbi:MAG: NAD(P)H-hydrate epimerase [Phycisphaerales bacterium]|nr:NAD(P)H-hydrate epimerase [Phycisphaerales bacterium]MCB9856036.1 NAD(P)H-hydrate epimerase [Phycisphaerales bacterium]MCB9863936.1 NAD(P)H-hydrate epimerase [Phycisphaerales bacterium]
MSIDPHQQENIYLTREQVRDVDRRAIEDFGIPGIVLMENAGRNAMAIILARLRELNRTDAGTIAIVCGRGNNGGDGFVIARHVSNAGSHVEIFLACEPDALKGDALTNYSIAVRMQLPMYRFYAESDIAECAPRLQSATIIVDAILGTGFSGDVRSPLNLVIQAINDAGRHTIAVDVPSGLDCNSGNPSNATVRADETITFVARKVGFRATESHAYLGVVDVVDIGAPRAIVQAVHDVG